MGCTFGQASKTDIPQIINQTNKKNGKMTKNQEELIYQSKELQDRKKKFQTELQQVLTKAQNCSNEQQGQKYYSQAGNIQNLINGIDLGITRLKDQRLKLEQHKLNQKIGNKIDNTNKMMNNATKIAEQFEKINDERYQIDQQHQRVGEMMKNSEKESVNKYVKEKMKQKRKNKIQKKQKKVQNPRNKNLNNGTSKPQNIDDVIDGLN